MSYMTLSSQEKHFFSLFILSHTSDNTTSQNIGGADAWAVPHLKFWGDRPPSLPLASIILFSSPSDRITCPNNPSFLLSAVCYSVSSSSIPISMRTLSVVFFSVHDILCIFLHIHISHALIFFSIFFVIVHVSQPYRTVGKISVFTILFLCLCSRVCLAITFLIQSL